jgi:putative transposase
VQQYRSYRFEVRATPEQRALFCRIAGSCRFVYNKALALQRIRVAGGHRRLSYAASCKALAAWKSDPGFVWLNDCPSQALQQALKDLDRAFCNFASGRAREPRFKRRGRDDRFRLPQGCKLEAQNARIFLPRIGWTRIRLSRTVEGVIGAVIACGQGGRWFVCIQTQRNVEPRAAAGGAVGIDLGVTRFATLSDGSHETVIQLPAPDPQLVRALRRAQRCQSRRCRFGKNWQKARGRVQRIHARITSNCLDRVHKVTAQISKNHAIVCLEKLQIGNMTRSSRGGVGSVDRNARRKAALNRVILQQNWFEFRRQLAYKLAWRGGRLILVSPRYTSRTCPQCGFQSKENRTSQARFSCRNCRYEANADLVAAMNILRAGHAQLARGDTSLIGASAREPAEELAS